MIKIPTLTLTVTLDDAWKAPYEGNKVYPDETVEEAVVVIETIEDTLNESIASLLLKNMSKLHSILSKVNSECRDRCFNAFDIPIMQVGSKQVLVNSCYAEDDTERHCSEISTVLVSKGIKSSVTEIVSLEQLFLK